MDGLAKKAVALILEEVKRTPDRRVERVKLVVTKDIILPDSGMAPGIRYSAQIAIGQGRPIETSGGIHCKSSPGNPYGHANEVATDIYSYFAARGVPVELTGEAMHI